MMCKFILWIKGVFWRSNCCEECNKLKQEIKRLKEDAVGKHTPSYFLNSLKIQTDQYKSCLKDYSRLNKIVYRFIEAVESPEWEQGNYSILKTKVKRFIDEVEDL